MSDKKERLEAIIEASLEEAKKKARMKMKGREEEEGEEEEEESSKHKKKMEESRHSEEEGEEEEEEESSKKHHRHKKKMEESRYSEEGEEEEEEREEEESGKYSKKASKKKVEEAKKYEEEEEEEEESSKKPRGRRKKMEEETQAAASLHAKSRPSDEPKSVVMSQMMQMAGGMSKEDLNKFAATMAQFGPGKDYGVGDKSSHNQASIDMKASHAAASKGPKTKDPMPKIMAKEDVEAMFVGEDLTEEFKEKATTLFEAAVSARVATEVARLEEEFEEAITEELKVFTEEVTDKLDSYLDYVVENWMSENEVAIESTLRNELMDEFVDGLRNLFAEHYINVPENKIDIVESLAERVDTLETELDEIIVENSEMKEILSDVAKKEIFEELTSDLALTQQEKFESLSEGIEFDGDIDVYTKKLRIIKETYFNNEKVTSNLEEETFEGDVSTTNINPTVNRYVQALTRTVKK